MKGGALIGQGTSGCVFKPAITCSGETKRRPGVSKVVFDDHIYGMEDEFNIKMQKLDQNGKFTNPILHKCMINKEVFHAEKGINQCRAMTAHSSGDNKYFNTIFKHSGIDLFEYFKTDFDISNPSLHNKMLSLFNGLKSIGESKMVHLDIKPPNILKTSTNFIFIDFGLSTNMNNVYSDNYNNITLTTYPYFPPEFKLYWAFENTVYDILTHIKRHGALTEKVVNGNNEITNEILRQIKILPPILNWEANYDSVEYIKSAFIKVGITSSEMHRQVDVFTLNIATRIGKIIKQKGFFDLRNDLRPIFDKFAEKIDVFSLGCVLIEMYYAADVTSLTKYQQTDLINIIKKMVDMNVINRVTAVEAATEYKHFIATLKSSPKAVTPKPPTPKAVTPKPPSYKIPTPKAPTPKAATPKAKNNDCKSFKLIELKEIAKRNKLPVSGSKAVLCDRVNELLPHRVAKPLLENKLQCKIPKLIEAQVSALCGKHAINNLLQEKRAECKDLTVVAKHLSDTFDIPLRELINNRSGYYDISVLVGYLQDQGHEIHQISEPEFKTISRRQSPRLIGYIFGNGHHWIAVRKTNTVGCYFEIDSLQDHPIKINVIKKWLLENNHINAIKVLKKR